ncbi:uncharacterized protein [Periplaneta americana]|uniref:uncharacterized protein isoform X2 n=1 Tax=Periplaneta americana TaxID=6978 RepID=UPI0037E85A67
MSPTAIVIFLATACVAVTGFTVDSPQDVHAIMSAMSNLDHQDVGLEEDMGLTSSLSEQLDSYLDSSTLSRVARDDGHFKTCCGKHNKTYVQESKKHFDECKTELKNKAQEIKDGDVMCEAMKCMADKSGVPNKKGVVSDDIAAKTISKSFEEDCAKKTFEKYAKEYLDNNKATKPCDPQRIMNCAKSAMEKMQKRGLQEKEEEGGYLISYLFAVVIAIPLFSELSGRMPNKVCRMPRIRARRCPRRNRSLKYIMWISVK